MTDGDGRTREAPDERGKASMPLLTLLPRHYHARIVKHSLGEAASQAQLLTCSKCYRSGLLERYGPNISKPNLRHEVARCVQPHSVSDPRLAPEKPFVFRCVFLGMKSTISCVRSSQSSHAL